MSDPRREALAAEQYGGLEMTMAGNMAAGAAPTLPSPEHVAWADAEIGVIIHQDLETYDPSYTVATGALPAASVFDPSAPDTDQWLATAKAGGATYAVLVAKHCSGFCLWPTAAYDFSVRQSPWKQGQGDLVADFMASCRKYGIRPGRRAHSRVCCGAVDGRRLATPVRGGFGGPQAD